MTAWSLDSVSLLAHGVHYALVAGGLVGVAWLLLPQLRSAGAGGTSDHDRRVALLRRAVADGTLLSLGPTAPPRPTYAADAALLLPVAVVASAAAAGVHAAMGPAHFRTATLFGLFFAASSIAQLAWTARVLHRPGRTLLELGVALNVGCVLLWALTRTLGLPLGLMPSPEPLGPWDLAAAGWELAVVAACVALLRAHPGDGSVRTLRIAPWADWHPGAVGAVVVSATVLTTLSLSGAGG